MDERLRYHFCKSKYISIRQEHSRTMRRMVAKIKDDFFLEACEGPEPPCGRCGNRRELFQSFWPTQDEVHCKSGFSFTRECVPFHTGKLTVEHTLVECSPLSPTRKRFYQTCIKVLFASTDSNAIITFLMVLVFITISDCLTPILSTAWCLHL